MIINYYYSRKEYETEKKKKHNELMEKVSKFKYFHFEQKTFEMGLYSVTVFQSRILREFGETEIIVFK